MFRSGNDLNAMPAQLHFDHRLLIRVAEKAVQLVHDDVLHPGGSCIGQHALEFRAFPPAAAVAMVLIDLYQLIPCRGGKGDDCTLLGFQRFLTLLIGRFTAIAKSPRGLHWRRNCGNHNITPLQKSLFNPRHVFQGYFYTILGFLFHFIAFAPVASPAESLQIVLSRQSTF